MFKSNLFDINVIAVINFDPQIPVIGIAMIFLENCRVLKIML